MENIEWVDSGGNKGVYSQCQLMKLEKGDKLGWYRTGKDKICWGKGKKNKAHSAAAPWKCQNIAFPGMIKMEEIAGF